MKYRNRKTGEIVEVISFSNNAERSKDDYVSYIDSKGGEHPREKGLNINWDFEIAPCDCDCDSRTKWEYYVIEFSTDSKDRKTLREMGEEGWELTSTIHYEGVDAVQFIFKRPKLSINTTCCSF